MQLEIILSSADPADYDAQDLGFLLHKHPARVHVRATAQGVARVFFPELSPARARAVIHLELDPVALVRGKGAGDDGLFADYVSDRAHAVNSLLSVALGKVAGQTIAGKSKERQALADRALPYEIRLVPLAVSGGREVVERVFAPLGYAIAAEELEGGVFDLRLSASIRLAEALGHMQVLIPVLDDAKHYFIGEAEMETLLARGGAWLQAHPERELIVRRALRKRRGLVRRALDRLAEEDAREEEAENAPAAADAPAPAPAPGGEAALEKPIRLHDLRLDAVCDVIAGSGARSVLDLGCGEGRLISRLVKLRGIERILGVDASTSGLEIAARKLHLDTAGEALRERVQLQLGGLTYADRRLRGFDLAALVEVIEHIDPARLTSVEDALFGDARPGTVVLTTPNRDYNALFPTLPAGEFRHDDHRFEWTRAEFAAWCARMAETYGYSVETAPLGPVDDAHGAPSQMAVFRRQEAA